jgi:hypothetical protein
VATAQLAPLPVNAGADETLCVVAPLDNDADVVATAFVAELQQGVHHVIVYRVPGAAASPSPAPCLSFDGALEGSAEPLFLADAPKVTFDLPAGAGALLHAHEMVRIEAHYLNASSQALTPGATVTVRGVPAAQAGSYQPAGFGVWATEKIAIPPNASGDTGSLFQAGIGGTTIFGVTSYEHALGTDVTVRTASGPADAQGTVVLDDKNWWNPALVAVSPPAAQDGRGGLAFRCTWLNTTTSAVAFGESASGEVCLVGVYYYPSKGPDVCIDGACTGR